MLTFIKVLPGEVERLRQISLDTFHHSFYHLNTPENYALYVAQSLNTEVLSKEIHSPQSEFYFGYQGAELVCYFKVNHNINCHEIYDPKSIELQRIYVAPAHISKGYGSVMLDFIKQYSRDKGFTTLWLGVWEHNPGAIRFYQRHGFLQIGAHDFTLGLERQTDLILEHKL